MGPILASPIALVFFILTAVMVLLSIRSELKESRKKKAGQAA